MRLKLSEETIKRLPVPASGNRVHYFAGATLQGAIAPRGFGVRVTAAGQRAFVLNYRLRGREHRFTIGAFPDWSALKAVREARVLRQLVDRGEDPLEVRKPAVEGKTVGAVLNDFMTRYARPKLRGAKDIESAFERLVKPRVGKVGIYELRRSHVAEMLDKIEDASGPVMADRTRAYFRKALSWYGERDDRFNLGAAIVRVEPRAEGRRRTRNLSPEEIKLIWSVLESQGTFGALVKALLLTGQRRSEVAGMSRTELGADGVWEIPAPRYKGKRPHFVPLSKAALAVIEAQPQVEKCELVFPSKVKTAFSGFGWSKAELDAAVLKAMRQVARQAGDDPEAVKPLPNWTLHDLRRTARTLMSGAGVPSEIAERVLGHAMSGLEATYDRHDYVDEKRDALERLAARIESIVTSPPANVVPMRRASE